MAGTEIRATFLRRDNGQSCVWESCSCHTVFSSGTAVTITLLCSLFLFFRIYLTCFKTFFSFFLSFCLFVGLVFQCGLPYGRNFSSVTLTCSYQEHLHFRKRTPARYLIWSFVSLCYWSSFVFWVMFAFFFFWQVLQVLCSLIGKFLRQINW